MILNINDLDAVIFDLDGTLYDSMWMWEQIDIEFLGSFGLAMPDDLQECIEGMSFSETAVYFKQRFDIPWTLDKIKCKWNEMAMDKYGHEVSLKKGAGEFVRKLKDRGVPMAIASSNSRQLIDVVLESSGMKDYFDAVVISCEVPRGKPAPDVYLLAAERVKADPVRCIVFEDIVPGIIGGKAAGMRVCAVEDEFSIPYREEKRRLADDYIWDYDEVELIWQI
ncbi:MAG: HAD family phosphatase [Lachnospiraceae bacterium]|nr:HAD family phosphatase [Lachnospiraceae bacterium]